MRPQGFIFNPDRRRGSFLEGQFRAFVPFSFSPYLNDREGQRREIYGRWEKRGRERGDPKGGGAGGNGKIFATLHHISQ